MRKLATAALSIWLAMPAAMAQTRCRVMDPTGTPLNVRTAPNGRVVGNLPNGVLVAIVDQAVDANGKSWVYVKPMGGDSTLG